MKPSIQQPATSNISPLSFWRLREFTDHMKISIIQNILRSSPQMLLTYTWWFYDSKKKNLQSEYILLTQRI